MFLKHPPKTVYVSSSRILCAKNADFEGMKAGGGGVPWHTHGMFGRKAMMVKQL